MITHFLEWRRYGSSVDRQPLKTEFVCPDCGYNEHMNRPIDHGVWTYYPTKVYRYGVLTSAHPNEARLLHLLARSHPFPLKTDVIGRRIFPHSRNRENYVKQVVSSIRQRFKDDCPIKHTWTQGYHLTDGELNV